MSAPPTAPTAHADDELPVAAPTAHADDDLPVAWFDWLTWPALVAGGLLMTAALLPRMSPTLVTVLLVAALIAVLAVLERVRPQRARAPRTEPFHAELGHVLFGLELGSILGYAGAVALAEALAGTRASLGWWPAGWPLALEVALGLLVVDGFSYAQHRAMHRVAALWPLHALHHQPRALDSIKVGRFHAVDIAANAFFSYLPLLALGAPPVVVAWAVTVNTIGGMLQHANARLPTPAWLDGVVCTPAAHWRHHGRAAADDGNYASLCMLFDRALGTWVATGGRRPARLGLEHDPLPRGWLPPLLAPFRRRTSS